MRLFIAFELELKVKETLLSIQKQVASDKRSKVRWMGSQQLHLTLKFLGEVSNDKLDSIKQGFQQAVLGISPFQLKILGSGCFPGRGSVRIIWAGVEKPWESILACSDRVESVCQELGFEREKRSFTPHITVARVKFDNSKGNLRSAVEAAFFEPVEQRVQSICLYKSTLQPSGAQYDIIHREALLGWDLLPRGVLLVGPPGSGKTLLGRAVAGETNARFFVVSASEFVEMFVGVGAARVRDMFETAAKNTPAVIFIDELDAVGRRRGSGIGAGHDEREQTLNQLLVCLDGFEPYDRLVVIGATNRPDILDQALLRPGRFDRQIKIPEMTNDDRLEVLKIHTSNKTFDEGVSLEEIASQINS